MIRLLFACALMVSMLEAGEIKLPPKEPKVVPAKPLVMPQTCSVPLQGPTRMMAPDSKGKCPMKDMKAVEGTNGKTIYCIGVRQPLPPCNIAPTHE